jgi:hypothetical protein
MRPPSPSVSSFTAKPLVNGTEKIINSNGTVSIIVTHRESTKKYLQQLCGKRLDALQEPRLSKEIEFKSVGMENSENKFIIMLTSDENNRNEEALEKH